MNSTGARRFAAVFGKSYLSAALAATLFCCATVRGADCDPGSSAEDKIARFKELDSAAERAMKEHQPAEAVRLYKEAVCLVPDSARGYYGLGVAEAAANELLDARESLRTADRLQPTTGMPLLMQVRVNFSLGDMEALKSSLREAADRFPRDVELHTNLARFLAQGNLFTLALAEGMRSQQSAADPNSRVQLAVLENTVGAYDDAIKNALAVEQDHQLPDQVRGAAAGVAGLSYESTLNPEQAAKYLNEAIQLDPSQDNSYLALADLLDQQQKYADAVNVLQKARANVPDSMPVLLALGADLVRAEHYKEGVEVLRKVISKAPGTPEAYLSLADAARKTGDAEGEVRALRELERYKPDYPMIHVLIARAMLNHAAPPYRDVLQELSTARKKAPNDPEVYFLQGKVYAALGSSEEAITALQHSIELRPTDPSTYYQLARIYQKLGKSDLAKEQFERVKYLESSAAK